MQRSIIAVLVALCVLGTATSASGNRAYHRMTFAFAATVAVDYWNQRLVHVPCRPHVKLMSDVGLEAIDEMFSDVPACTVEVAHSVDEWRTSNRLSRSNYCWDVVHEVGHLAGLEHPGTPAFDRLPDRVRAMLPDTVMNVDGAPYPWGCTHPRKFLRYWEHRHILKPYVG